MKMRNYQIAILVLAICCQASFAADTIFLKGSSKIFSGRITRLTPKLVEIENRGVKEQVSIGKIRMVSFDRETRDISAAKKQALRENNYERAMELLKKVQPEQIPNNVIQQELDYYKAYCQTKLAISGRGNLATAIRAMTKFVKTYDTSYHFFEAYELIGEMQFLNNDMNAAISAYDQLKKSGIRVLDYRASNLKGAAYMIQGNYKKASASFGEVLRAANATEAAEKDELLNATVGNAKCNAGLGKAAEGIGILNKVIKETSAENSYVHAKAYNALGYCLQKSGKNREALLAYLHVDVLYSKEADEHAQALSKIGKLWETMKENGKSSKTFARLNALYPNSHWSSD